MHIVAHEMQQGQIFSHQERDLLDFYLFIVLLSMLCFMSHFPHLVNMDNDLLLVQSSEKEIGSEVPFSTLLRASRSKKSQGSLQIQPATEVHRGGSWYTGQNVCPSLLFRTCPPGAGGCGQYAQQKLFKASSARLCSATCLPLGLHSRESKGCGK